MTVMLAQRLNSIIILLRGSCGFIRVRDIGNPGLQIRIMLVIDFFALNRIGNRTLRRFPLQAYLDITRRTVGLRDFRLCYFCITSLIHFCVWASIAILFAIAVVGNHIKIIAVSSLQSCDLLCRVRQVLDFFPLRITTGYAIPKAIFRCAAYLVPCDCDFRRAVRRHILDARRAKFVIGLRGRWR